MANILEELWYGNLCPCEQEFKEQDKYVKLIEDVEKKEKNLMKVLSENDKKLLKIYTKSFHKLNTFAEKESFIKGFSLAVKLILAGKNSD